MEIIYRRALAHSGYLHRYKIQISMQINVLIYIVRVRHLINGFHLIAMKSSISLKCG